MTSTARSTPFGVDDAGGGHRRHRPRYQLDVLLLERGIEGAGNDGPLAGIGVLRRHRLAQVGSVGELAGDVVEAELLAGLVELGAGTVELPPPQGLLEHVLQPPALPRAPPRLGESGALLVGEVALALGHDPSRLALEHVELLDHRLDRRHDLGGRRSGADHGHDLAGQVVLVLPAGGMELRTLEVVEPGPVGVAGHVQEPDSTQEHVALVDAPVVELDRPDVTVVVPRGGLHADAELQVRPEAELVDRLLQVLLQLGLRGVRAGPVVALEREAVQVRAHVDLRTGVRVVPPRPTDAERRLVDRERVDAGLLHLHARRDPAEPGADHHGSRGPRGTEERHVNCTPPGAVRIAATTPPSTGRSIPLTKLASSDSRNATADCHLLGAPLSAQRRVLHEQVVGLAGGGLLTVHRRVDDAGRDRADASSEPAEPHRFALHEPVDTPLGPDVGHARVLDLGSQRRVQPIEEAWVEGIVERGIDGRIDVDGREQRRHRREAHDGGVRARERKERVDEHGGADEVDGHHRAPVRHRRRDAGGVDDRVQGAQLRERERPGVAARRRR